MVLPPEIAALVAAQARYDELHRVHRPRAGTAACDLAYANPYDGPDEAVIEAMTAVLQSRATLQLQYTPYGGHTVVRRRVADHIAEQLGAAFRWYDVVLTPGAMAALNVIFRSLALSSPGGEVIVLTPCWMDYPLYLVNLGLTPVLVPLRTADFRFDLEKVASAITGRTVAILFSQPANPTGVAYSDDELAALASVIRDTSAKAGCAPMLISDECHRDVTFSPGKVPSPVRHYERTCVVYSFGKSLLIQGQRIGYVAVSPDYPGRRELATQFEQLCRVMGFCTPTALMQTALLALVGHRSTKLEAYRAQRQQAASGLKSLGFTVVESTATYFVYAAIPRSARDDFEFCETLAKRAVFVLPSALFHHTGHFRMSVTASEQMIHRALEVLRDEGDRRGEPDA